MTRLDAADWWVPFEGPSKNLQMSSSVPGPGNSGRRNLQEAFQGPGWLPSTCWTRPNKPTILYMGRKRRSLHIMIHIVNVRYQYTYTYTYVCIQTCMYLYVSTYMSWSIFEYCTDRSCGYVWKSACMRVCLHVGTWQCMHMHICASSGAMIRNVVMNANRQASMYVCIWARDNVHACCELRASREHSCASDYELCMWVGVHWTCSMTVHSLYSICTVSVQYLYSICTVYVIKTTVSAYLQ